MSDIREYDASRTEASQTLLLLDRDNIPSEVQHLHAQARRTARKYAWNKLLEYSVAHPHRTCTLSCGMGYCTLHVERGPHIQGAWRFEADNNQLWDRKFLPPPDFLVQLWRFGEELGENHQDWFMSGQWAANHGVMIVGELY